MTDQELIQTAKQAMEDLWNSNNGKLMDYEQSAYNCLRLLCIRLEEVTSIDHPDDVGSVPKLTGVKKKVKRGTTLGIFDANSCISLPYK